MRDRGHGAGIALNAFRLNTAASHAMSAGRRGRVYDRLVILSGVPPSYRARRIMVRSSQRPNLVPTSRAVPTSSKPSRS
jgi:hypothetical protein